ncbi:MULTISPECIES: hypothetical protein [Bacillaceae]|uniref:hypothetical protein n=1 Tax=Bacillaceae TaxID=186817 RepID=UPI001BDEC4E7|nr:MULTISPECIES: hypothetical protein [Bacillaceae]MDX8359292.1 hypothetical protein [Cytobacillus sp. IB215316]MDX8368050.1 hypothetical protein [Cytobacillus sp. IB215665]
MIENFIMDKRLGISIPKLQKNWEDFTKNDQQAILLHWEKVRGKIPDRIADLEKIINNKQAALGNENDFQRSCILNSEIAELASIINDLWLWYRINQNVTEKIHV